MEILGSVCKGGDIRGGREIGVRYHERFGCLLLGGGYWGPFSQGGHLRVLRNGIVGG